MLESVSEALREEVPGWVYLGFVTVIALTLLIVATPLLQHLLDRGECTQAISAATDSKTFDAAYDRCVALGIVPAHK